MAVGWARWWAASVRRASWSRYHGGGLTAIVLTATAAFSTANPVGRGELLAQRGSRRARGQYVWRMRHDRTAPARHWWPHRSGFAARRPVAASASRATSSRSPVATAAPDRRCRGNARGLLGARVRIWPLRSGQTETSGCNDCGTHTRQCDGNCNWSGWSACQGSGAIEAMACGNCGVQTVECRLDGTATAQSVVWAAGPAVLDRSRRSRAAIAARVQRSCGERLPVVGWSGCQGPDSGRRDASLQHGSGGSV